MRRSAGRQSGRSWARRGAALFLCLGLLFPVLSGSAKAQTGGNTVETEDPDRARGEVDAAADDLDALTQVRQALQSGSSRQVTYAEILKDPDNIALNVAYARQQVEQGRLKAAATTLERVLLVEPKLHEVRLFYALVLIRLDSLETAERELEQLRQLDMPPDLRAQLDGLIAQINNRRRRWEASLLTGVGVSYDWNITGVPANRQVVFAGVPARLDDQSDRTGDFAFTAFSRVDIAYDLGFQARHQLIGSATGYFNDKVNVDRLDVGSYAVDAGLRLRLPGFTLTPEVFHSVLWLSHERYYANYGGQVKVRVPLPPDIALFGQAGYTNEGFNRISETTSAVQDSGWRLDGLVGLEWDLDARNRLTFTYDARAKYGAFNYDHNWRHGLTADYLRILDKGVFVGGNLRLARRQDFRGDPFVDPARQRQDDIVRVRARIGAPINALIDLDGMPDAVRNGLGKTVASATGEVYRSMSNIRNYQYWNRRADVLLTRKWTF